MNTRRRTGDHPSRIVNIVRAAPADAGVLSEIAISAKRHWGYPERWIESWRELLNIQPEWIRGHETYVALIENRQVGFYGLSPVGNRLHLEHLWVLPDAMGAGVGRALFTHALERARASGFSSLEMESDPHAEGFYQRMGAFRIGVRITELEDRRRELPILLYEIEPSHPPDGV